MVQGRTVCEKLSAELEDVLCEVECDLRDVLDLHHAKDVGGQLPAHCFLVDEELQGLPCLFLLISDQP